MWHCFRSRGITWRIERLQPSVLKCIRPQQAAAIKLQLKGSMESKFQNAIINEATLAAVA